MSPGFSLVETLVCMVLVLLVANAVAMIVATQNRASLRIRDEAEAMEAGRIVRVVLEGELRYGMAGRDWQVAGGDTIGLRAFRGIGIVCGAADASGAVTVRYRGSRQPNPAKDSVLILVSGGRWDTRELVRVDMAEDDCAGGDALPARDQLWTFDRPARGGIFLRVFERGSYHIADDAFRYRSGQAGRQPLTPQRIDDERSHLSGSAGGMDVDLYLRRGGRSIDSAGSGGFSGPPAVHGGDRWRVWLAENPR